MTTLSKEYFDQHMKGINQRFDSVDQRFDNVEKKIEDEIHGLATMVAKGFDDLAKRLDVRERVEKLETKVTTIESALNVRL
jgi:chaperonin cofactor prefoldin